MERIVCLTVILAALLLTVALPQAEPAMPDSIVRVGACSTPGVAWGVFVQGDYAYIADRSRLTLVNTSVPSIPWVVSDLSTPFSEPVGVSVQDTIAYCHQGVGGMFSAVSVAQPSSLYVLGWCFIPNGVPEPKGLSVSDTVAFVADADDGLVIIDVAISGSPTVIDSFDTPGTAIDLFCRDTLVYVADLESLQIINVAALSSAFRVGAIGMPNTCYDVFVVDTFAYVACQSSSGTDGTLQIVNVSDPGSPFIVNNVTMNGDPFAVYVSGAYAYVATVDWWSLDKWSRVTGDLRPPWAVGFIADIEGGVRVVDISDPLSPSLVASYDTPGDSRGVFAVGDLVFVADYDSLQILRHIVVGVEESAPAQSKKQQLRLLQNEPNPFSDLTSISYELPAHCRVTLTLQDISGRLVAFLVDEQQHAGWHALHWNGKSEDGTTLPSGVYFYRLTAQGSRRCGKMILLR